MAPDWESEMQDKIDKLQAALTAEFRTQLTAQLTAMGAQLEQSLEKRLDASMSHRLSVQTEELREIVRTAAGNYGGVLDAIRLDLREFRDEWRKKTEVTNLVLANHVDRIVAIEKTLSKS
jgi:hypothetical protein